MNTTQTTASTLAALITAAETMSTEARKAQQRGARGTRYGKKFDAAREAHLAACYWLQANNRPAWQAITADNHVSADAARKILAGAQVAA